MILAGVAVAIGAFVTLYHGPGRPFLRGHVGDLAATMLVYGLLGLARPSTRMWVRGALTFGIAVAIECLPLVYRASSSVGAFVLGQQFDWIDMIMYFLGTCIGMLVTVVSLRRPDPSAT